MGRKQVICRVITPEQEIWACDKCRKFFIKMAETLIANGETMKIMVDFPGPESNHIAYSKIAISQNPEKEEFPPIRIKISANKNQISSYLEFYPEEGAGAKRLLLEILLQLYSEDEGGFSHDFYDGESSIPPNDVAILMLSRVRVMRAIYKKHQKALERIYQKELDFTAELYADEAEKIIQSLI